MAQSNEISPQTLRELMDQYKVKLIDLRDSNDYESGHLKGAKHINLSESYFASEIEELNKSNKYVVYDENGENGDSAVQLMKRKGFEDVKNLEGGIQGWRNCGFEVVD